MPGGYAPAGFRCPTYSAISIAGSADFRIFTGAEIVTAGFHAELSALESFASKLQGLINQFDQDTRPAQQDDCQSIYVKRQLGEFSGSDVLFDQYNAYKASVRALLAEVRQEIAKMRENIDRVRISYAESDQSSASAFRMTGGER